MGNDSSKISSINSQSSNLIYGFSSVQGRRLYNEDRFDVRGVDIFAANKGSTSSANVSQASHLGFYLAVFDGHGGAFAAQQCADRLHDFIKRKSKLKKAFLNFDANLLQMQQKHVPAERSGSTAVVTIVTNKNITTANIGDSRSLLSRGGKAIELSIDHKPINKDERRRIELAGGRVTVPILPSHLLASATALSQISYAELGDKGLAVSRAFGNVSFKSNKSIPPDEQVIVSTPTIKKIPRAVEDEFLLLASDGLFDVLTNQETIDWVRYRLIALFATPLTAVSNAHITDSDHITSVAEALTQHALDLQSNDNVTVVIAVFPHWLEAIKNGDISTSIHDFGQVNSNLSLRSSEQPRRLSISADQMRRLKVTALGLIDGSSLNSGIKDVEVPASAEKTLYVVPSSQVSKPGPIVFDPLPPQNSSSPSSASPQDHSPDT